MRKLFSMFALIASVAMVIGCKPDTPEPQPQPQPGVKPEITLTAGALFCRGIPIKKKMHIVRIFLVKYY